MQTVDRLVDNPAELPADPDGLAQWCRAHGITKFLAGGCDTHGMWKGKWLPIDELSRSCDKGVAFSDVFFILSHAEDLVEPPGGANYPLYFPRKEFGFGDLLLKPDLRTARSLLWHDGAIGVTGDYFLASGDEVPIAPRNLLNRVLDNAHALGYEARVGVELELYFFRGSYASLCESGFRLVPIHPRGYSYGVHLNEDLLSDIRRCMAGAAVKIEATNPEMGPGQFELNIRYAEALRAADDAFFYRNAVKEIAARHGLLASFMAKPNHEWPGSSCHIHQSLWSLDGAQNLFASESATGRLADEARWYIGGILDALAELTVLFCPLPNSYKRLVPYSWGGTTVTWGYDNRSTSVRAIPETDAAARVELRLAGADVNPYIAVAASLGAGLRGIERKIEPPEPFQGDAYATDGLPALPLTLDDALRSLRDGQVAKEIFGPDFIEQFATMKQFELDLYREQVTPWEVERYAELA